MCHIWQVRQPIHHPRIMRVRWLTWARADGGTKGRIVRSLTHANDQWIALDGGRIMLMWSYTRLRYTAHAHTMVPNSASNGVRIGEPMFGDKRSLMGHKMRNKRSVKLAT